MKPYLLDINVLLALAWPSHMYHRQALEWFVRKKTAGFRTCPLTQTGFVRISSNPSFSPQAVSPMAALGLLERITAMPEHEFWPEDLPLASTISETRPLAGHRQVTDAYLVALTAARDGVLATLDRGVMAVAGEKRNRVELV